MASATASTWLEGHHRFVALENATLEGRTRILLYQVRGTERAQFILWPFMVRK